MFRDSKELHAAVAGVQAETEAMRDKRKQDNQKKAQEKARKNRHKKAAVVSKRIELLPSLREHICQGLGSQTNLTLKNILLYFFDKPSAEVSQMSKPALLEELERRWEEVKDGGNDNSNNVVPDDEPVTGISIYSDSEEDEED